MVIFLLLGLLVVLATLQYRWLGQISHAESTRLSNRLADDTGRFTKDFDSEIQKAFFALQVDADVFKANDLRVFKKRLLFVRQEAVVPGLIEDVFYLDGPDSRRLRRFDEN